MTEFQKMVISIQFNSYQSSSYCVLAYWCTKVDNTVPAFGGVIVQLSDHKIIIYYYIDSAFKWLHVKLIFQSLNAAAAAAAAAKSPQSYPTLCNPIDGSPTGFYVPGILQARTLEWEAISFSNAWKWKVKVKSLSRVWLLMTPWTAAYQASPSMGFSRQGYRSGSPVPSPSELQYSQSNIPSHSFFE